MPIRYSDPSAIAAAAVALVRARADADVPISLVQAIAIISGEMTYGDNESGRSQALVAAAADIRSRLPSLGVIESTAIAEHELSIAAGPAHPIGAETAVEYAMLTGKVSEQNRPWAITYARLDVGAFMDLVERMPVLTNRRSQND